MQAEARDDLVANRAARIRCSENLAASIRVLLEEFSDIGVSGARAWLARPGGLHLGWDEGEAWILDEPSGQCHLIGPALGARSPLHDECGLHLSARVRHA